MTITVNDRIPILPGDLVDVHFIWGDWLPTGDLVQTETTSTATPLVVESSSINSEDVQDQDGNVYATGTVVSAWISLAEETVVTEGQEIRVDCRITTTGGRSRSQSIKMRLTEKRG